MTFLLKRFSYHCSYRWKFMKLGWKLPVFKALANWKALKFFLRTERVLIPRMKSDCLSLESFNFATVHTSFRWHRSGWFNPSYNCLSTPVREELKVSCALVLKGTRRRIDITREGWALKGELGEIMLEMICPIILGLCLSFYYFIFLLYMIIIVIVKIKFLFLVFIKFFLFIFIQIKT